MSDSDDPPACEVEMEDAYDDATGAGFASSHREAPAVPVSVTIERSHMGDGYLKANGHWFDDEPPRVEVHANGPLASLNFSLTPEEAHEFAAELREAAIHATQGAAEAGWFDE